MAPGGCLFSWMKMSEIWLIRYWLNDISIKFSDIFIRDNRQLHGAVMKCVPASPFGDISTFWGKSLTPNRSLNQWWLRPMTPYDVTRPQWVNSLLNGYGAVILKILSSNISSDLISRGLGLHNQATSHQLHRCVVSLVTRNDVNFG